MEFGEQVLMSIQIISAATILLAIYFHLRLSFLGVENVCQNLASNESDEIRVILPMRNEASNVRRVISDVIKEILAEDNCYVSVIDSNSSDSTFSLAKQILKDSALSPARWEVIAEKKPGKSRAINSILDSTSSDMYVMMDADVTPQEGWLTKLKQGISIDEVGVVSGIESNSHKKNNSRGNYKAYSDKVRIKQSLVDTAPILEGGLICWKKAAIGEEFRLNEDSNADDAQIVFRAIRKGYRTVILENLLFEDLGISGTNFNRSVRRSQGLSRVLVKNIDLCLTAPRKEARKSISYAFSVYVLFPWALFCFFLNPILSIILHDNPASWHYLLLTGLLIVATNRLGRSALWGASISIIGHILFLIGIRFSYWNGSKIREFQ